jgi:hypothetical protein
VAGDDEFGRCCELRAARRRRRRYVPDVPCNTLVRALAERRPPTRPGGRPRPPLFERVDRWAARQPAGRWRKVKVRDGEKGPIAVRALPATVRTKDEDGCVGPSERPAVLRSCEKRPRTWYAPSNAREAKRAELARAHGARHRVEELWEEGKGEVGPGRHEVRGWVGRHHHRTLSLLALWFLQAERLRLGGKTPAVTVPQVRAIFTELLREPNPGAARIAEVVAQVLRRNEEARLDHWYAATGRFPPQRPRPGPRPRG